MPVYTCSQARRNLAAVLEQACQEGEVRIKRRDGQVFVIKPEPKQSSPLDVPGVDIGLSAEEILAYIREGRRVA
jgi:hypothetical protein